MICCVILSLFHDVLIGFTMVYHHKYHHVQYLFAVSNSIFQQYHQFPHFPISNMLWKQFHYVSLSF